MGFERMRIPDDAVPEWMQTLRKGGFTDEEIDSIMGWLNQEYARAKGIDHVEDELERIEKHLKDTYGQELSAEQREYLRRSIASRPEFREEK